MTLSEGKLGQTQPFIGEIGKDSGDDPEGQCAKEQHWQPVVHVFVGHEELQANDGCE